MFRADHPASWMARVTVLPAQLLPWAGCLLAEGGSGNATIRSIYSVVAYADRK